MKNSLKILVVVLAAVLIAAGSAYFITGWYNVIPWVMATLMLGFVTGSNRNSILFGAIFGYVLFLVYIRLGYNGKTDAKSMFYFLLFNVLFSLIGGLAGVAGAFLGNWLKRKFNK